MNELHVNASHDSISVSVKHSRIHLSISSADLINDNHWHICRVNVIKDHRGKGLGSAMLKTLVEEVRKKGGKLITVHPGGYDGNTEEQFNFYLKNGFSHSADEGGLELTFRHRCNRDGCVKEGTYPANFPSRCDSCGEYMFVFHDDPSPPIKWSRSF